MIGQIRKRDGTITKFNKDKIANAIYGAAREAGGESRTAIAEIADKVLEKVESEMPKGSIPTVEGIQDIVEQVLIETGHAKTAKAYIIYRQKRAELRTEKKHILEKDEIDEVDKKFDPNALKVLKARYLRKDESGKLVETPKQLFTRVATHVALPELLYDERVFTQGGTPQEYEEFEAGLYDGEFSIGSFVLNKYHLEALKRTYDRFNRNGNIKMSWTAFLELLKNGAFSVHEKALEEFYQIMINKQFMPNTPAIANFGSVLGMGSACFHPDQLVITENGPEKISEIKVGDAVLTHKGRFKKVKEVFMRETNSLLSFECSKLPKPALLATDDHPILAYKNGEMNWYPAYAVNKGDHVALSFPTEIEDVEKIKVSDFVQEVTVENGECRYQYSGGKFNAFVHTTKSVKNVIDVDYDLMKLFGFYLSEGTVSQSDNVRFTLSTDEMDYCQEIVSIMEKKFGVTARIETNSNPERKWLSLRFHSTILAKFFENLFGTGFNKKRIPAWIMTLPAEKQKGMMSGMIRGDGTVFKNWGKLNAKLVMSNTNLVYAFWQMCMRCGVFAGLGKESMPKLARVQPVRCTLGTAKGQLLMNELLGTCQEVTTEDKTMVVNGVVFTEIESVEKIDYNGPVFNLEVEEDHSYVANMVSVHNCFVLGIEDNLESIMDSLKYTAIIHQSGGGTGFNFSKLRPEGDVVKSTCGAASGPLSFMSLYDNMTDVIKQGGMRRGANMGIMNSNHPDIEKFITAKEGNKALRNFNISVLVMGDFWKYYETDEPYPLINPRNGKIERTVSPRMLFDKIVYQAWESAEPGVIFADRANEFNPFLKHLGPITTTNPCGEVLLYPNEPCNLGSVNVWSFVRESESGEVYVDWDGMQRVITTATRFMDNAIDINRWPLKQIEDMALATRKIGFGIMGAGDMLFEMGLPYDDDDGRAFMEQLMEFVNYWTKVESVELAKERGPMPYLDKSFYPQGRLPFAGATHKNARLDWSSLTEEVKKYGIRNGYTTVLAPTGSISMIAGCSSGIEPVYSLVFEKNVKVGSFYYIDPVFEKVMRRQGLYDEDLMKQIAENRGRIKNVPYIPQRLKKVFVTAMDVTPENHIRALATFQRWVDSSISKTNNFPANATVDDMRQSYMLAYQLGCKGVTVFRDSSIKEQVLVAPKREKVEEVKKERYVTIKETTTETSEGTLLQHKTNGVHKSKYDYTNCPTCDSTAISFKEGCVTCESCGWGLCS